MIACEEIKALADRIADERGEEDNLVSCLRLLAQLSYAGLGVEEAEEELSRIAAETRDLLWGSEEES